MKKPYFLHFLIEWGKKESIFIQLHNWRLRQKATLHPLLEVARCREHLESVPSEPALGPGRRDAESTPPASGERGPGPPLLVLLIVSRSLP